MPQASNAAINGFASVNLLIMLNVKVLQGQLKDEYVYWLGCKNVATRRDGNQKVVPQIVPQVNSFLLLKLYLLYKQKKSTNYRVL